VTGSTHTNPDSEIESTCAYEGCFNPRDKDLLSTGVQSHFCGYHRENEGISVDSVTYDHKHNSLNNLKRGIESLKHQWQAEARIDTLENVKQKMASIHPLTVKEIEGNIKYWKSALTNPDTKGESE
jgi:hypothetical protein